MKNQENQNIEENSEGLKIPRWQHRAGSIPAPGTNENNKLRKISLLAKANNSGFVANLSHFQKKPLPLTRTRCRFIAPHFLAAF
ncbi:hypothetical protein [Methylotuvimicrobium alcaliphilum]|uniref:hypothetical protein n=1 Tax=Methylotuvimicrobium alcaliphilum TaxID=271065 RepID=UPI0002D610CC|nr:hypothetical protein [Methylotuvimicrobium alcaliphilum]